MAGSLALPIVNEVASAAWPHTWGGAADDFAQSVALDAAGNVYVAGTTSSFGSGGKDVLILKYSSTGTLKWAKTWGGGGDESANRVAIGPDGYVYVTGGTSSYGAGWFDIFLLKLDGNGKLLWGETWGGGSYDIGYDIAFDSGGNILVAAESYSNGNSAVILKFRPTGGPPVWSTFWKGPATYDSGYSLTVDSDFNIILAGTSWDDSGINLHNSALLVKYDAAGNYLWSQNWTTASPAQDESGLGHSLATDAAGNIYVGGHHSASCPSSNFSGCSFKSMVLKFAPGGDFQWAQTWGQSGFGYAGGIGFDPQGHLLVSGVLGQTTTPQLFVSSYDTNGGLLSATRWGRDQTVSTGLTPGMAVDSTGNALVVAGARNNSGAWESVSGTVRSLPNSVVVNPATVGTPTGQVTNLTNQTVPQTGVADIGGGGTDVLVLKYPHTLSGNASPRHFAGGIQ